MLVQHLRDNKMNLFTQLAETGHWSQQFPETKEAEYFTG